MSTRSLISRALQGIIRDDDIETSFYRRNLTERQRVAQRDRVARSRIAQKKSGRQVKLKPVNTFGSTVLTDILAMPKTKKRRRQ